MVRRWSFKQCRWLQYLPKYVCWS